ncbi:LysM peptidoglycan-binding domain-containing protein [Gordonia liuliyuniae]|uniref:LysM peptidoglycan-binding domain-containing protein n=1 Tax=Gordonia liuliyuniae TaxID=2911517 RepID=A0ABS9IRD2_9ACTN|nr:LysM peptidoglycan-binding domain-containing protein [Gordonia liuliyuniae]MCF8588120.1 LysM peptidoglycan-binding domain-containing protein [Gordonia liuliyuniae]
MAQVLISRPDERSRRVPDSTHSTVMTCDLPVLDGRPRVPLWTDAPARGCRPTGRAPRRAGTFDERRRSRIACDSQRAGRLEQRPSADRAGARRSAADRSNIDGVIARRRVVGALLLGSVLAGVVWMLTIVGSDYQDAVTPSTPGVTQVVHVRSGESLSDVARRVAADLPVAGVVEQLRELNHLESSGLRIGQPLIAPAY